MNHGNGRDLTMRVLFIGGTGLISSACSPLVVERGHGLTLVNRGTSAVADAPAGASVIHADARNAVALREALAGQHFDAVVQWIGFTPDHVAEDEVLPGESLAEG